MIKIKENILHVLLILMVATSFYLSYLIWMSPVGRDTFLKNESAFETIEEKVEEINKENIFLPIKVRYSENNKNQETQNESLLLQIQQALSNKTYHRTKWKSYFNENDYSKAIDIEHGFELTYGMLFPITEYLDLFNLNIDISEEEQVQVYFTKIQLDVQKNEVRFINEEDWTVYSVRPEKKLTKVLEIIKKVDYQWRPVSESVDFLSNQFLTQNELTLKKYSYISSTRRYTLFRDAFFTNPKDVRSNGTSADTYLYDGTETLIMKQNQEIVLFENVLENIGDLSIFEMSFPYVQRMGSNYGSVRVLNQARNQIDYRMFVEGFPIFAEDFEGQLAFSFSDSGQGNQKNINIQGNLKTLQIPIPSQEEVVLPATEKLVQTLYQNGADLKQIRTFMIGYEWKNIENTGVVDLIPNWFIKYGDTWLSYEGLLNQLTEGGGV